MTTENAIQVPRARYGLVMAAATLLAAAVSWAVARGMGADSATLRAVLAAAALGALPTLAPAVLRLGREHWGVFVMGAGCARLLLSLGYCYMAREASPELASRPLFVGVVAGALLLLVVEVATSIKILSAMERRREAGGADPAHRKLA